MTIEDIALTLSPGVGIKGAVHLLGLFGDAQQIFAASEEELVTRAELRREVAQQLVRRVAFKAAERELAFCAKHDIRAIASTDDAYPPLLREIPDYPHILYIKGAQEALTARCVSMVGTREATPYGQRMCIDLVCGLAERIPNLSVVSGLAYGIDVACHRAALAAGAQTVAVLPNPLPNIMPVPHTAVARDILESGGALVTELHSQVKQKGTFYLARNRIIAALSVGTVVVESPCAGGSLVTAHCADSYNRTVMAVPGRATDLASRGANLLIRNKKAQAVLSANDIIEELMWDLNLADCGARQSTVLPTLTADEAGVLGCFRTSDPVSTEELGELSSLNVGDLSVLLLGLEMAGAVRQLPGNRYMKMVQ